MKKMFMVLFVLLLPAVAAPAGAQELARKAPTAVATAKTYSPRSCMGWIFDVMPPQRGRFYGSTESVDFGSFGKPPRLDELPSLGLQVKASPFPAFGPGAEGISCSLPGGTPLYLYTVQGYTTNVMFTLSVHGQVFFLLPWADIGYIRAAMVRGLALPVREIPPRQPLPPALELNGFRA